MKLYSFKAVYDKYSEITDGNIPEESKLRDKLAEIIEAVGIEKDLLKAKEKLTGVDGETIKGSAYAIPEESVEFFAMTIVKYTSADFKLLRQAEFLDMSVEEIKYLYDGFIRYLILRGYDNDTISHQRFLMDRRMKYRLRISEQCLKEELEKVKQLAEEYEKNPCSFNYDDAVYFLRYMANKIEASRDMMESVYGHYTDIRSEELYEIALVESEKESGYESNVKITLELRLAKLLEDDDEYQSLLKQREKIIAEPGFIQHKQGRWKKVSERLQEIEKKYEIEVYGQLQDREEPERMVMKHPISVLEEAIRYEEECRKDYLECEIKEANKTDKDREREKAAFAEIEKMLAEKGFPTRFSDRQ